MPSNLITVRAYSLENKERYNVVLVKRISNCCFIDCKDKTSSWHNRYAGPPNRTEQKKGGVVIIVITYDNRAVEPYISRALGQQ